MEANSRLVEHWNENADPKKLSKAAWVVLIGSICSYEYYCPEGATLSESLDDFVDKPTGKLVIGAIGLLTVAHLLNIFDFIGEDKDPFVRAFDLSKKILIKENIY